MKYTFCWKTNLDIVYHLFHSTFKIQRQFFDPLRKAINSSLNHNGNIYLLCSGYLAQKRGQKESGLLRNNSCPTPQSHHYFALISVRKVKSRFLKLCGTRWSVKKIPKSIVFKCTFIFICCFAGSKTKIIPLFVFQGLIGVSHAFVRRNLECNSSFLLCVFFWLFSGYFWGKYIRVCSCCCGQLEVYMLKKCY